MLLDKVTVAVPSVAAKQDTGVPDADPVKAAFTVTDCVAVPVQPPPDV